MSTTRIIKKYANRKFYDTESSLYINYSEMLDILLLGDDIKVVDNRDQQEITYQSLLQIIHAKELDAIHSELEYRKFLNQVIRSKYGTFSGYILEKESEHITTLNKVALVH